MQSSTDAWLESRTLNGVWLLTEDGEKFKAYNGHCTHLGCSYIYDKERKNFFCPCHRGQFDVKTGQVLAGPPPRQLDELEVEVRDSRGVREVPGLPTGNSRTDRELATVGDITAVGSMTASTWRRFAERCSIARCRPASRGGIRWGARHWPCSSCRSPPGIVLAMYYSPSPDHAYDSIQYLERSVASGAMLRGIHHWGASAMVLLVVAHMVRVFTMGAYKYPREVNWLLGVVLLVPRAGLRVHRLSCCRGTRRRTGRRRSGRTSRARADHRRRRS